MTVRTPELAVVVSNPPAVDRLLTGVDSVHDCEEIAYKLLVSLPRSRLATIQRRIAPLLQFDVVGTLPTEVGLRIFSYLSYQSLLTCALVCNRWRELANDQSLWRSLCQARGWKWRHASKTAPSIPPRTPEWEALDDEGMGHSEDEDADAWGPPTSPGPETTPWSYSEHDSGLLGIGAGPSSPATPLSASPSPVKWTRHSAPAALKGPTPVNSPAAPDYKLLHQTHIKIQNRFINSNYRLSALQTRGLPRSGHAGTIYCLQLYTYPETGKRVLFTGSRDRTVREWNVATGAVERVIAGVHTSSVLSLCVHNGYLASAGGDRTVVVWHLASNSLVKVLSDHDESVLGVRFNDQKLASCSKDRTVRVYSFPDLSFQCSLSGHQSAVNAIAISGSFLVSASGDRSVCLWNMETGNLLQTFESHHSKGIASIDFDWPMLLSGSSDTHLRLTDLTTMQGWSTFPEYNTPPSVASMSASLSLLSTAETSEPKFKCQSCGSNDVQPTSAPRAAHNRHGVLCVHTHLVRTVALGKDLAVSGSYDRSIKVWDRATGALVADLAGGHTGRIFCVDFDATKIVSSGEDQRICIWDFAHGMDTSFLDVSS